MTEMNSELLEILTELGIPYRFFTHPPVYSTADIELLEEKPPGVDTKNLFLRDEKRTRYILVCVRAETRVRLKELGRSLGIKGLTFASPEELLEILGLTPGSVCLFGLMNDKRRVVTGYLDRSIPLKEEMQNHPLVNTATLVLSSEDIERFCAYVGHTLVRVDVPV